MLMIAKVTTVNISIRQLHQNEFYDCVEINIQDRSEFSMSGVCTGMTLLALLRNLDIYEHIAPCLNMLHTHLNLLLLLQSVVLGEYRSENFLGLEICRV